MGKQAIVVHLSDEEADTLKIWANAGKTIRGWPNIKGGLA
jgi:hypothetical protein